MGHGRRLPCPLRSWRVVGLLFSMCFRVLVFIRIVFGRMVYSVGVI